MLQAHIDAGVKISLATIPVNEKDAPSFGILKTDHDNNITSFIEKPVTSLLSDWTSPVSDEMKNQGKNHLASMGIYIFNKDLLIELMNDKSTIDFGKEIIPQAIGKHKIRSYQFEGYWTDIGNIESFFEANLGLTDDIPEFNLYDDKQRVFTNARLLPTSKISDTHLKKAVIAEGCIIQAAKIERSVIGIRSRIGKDSTVINTYMMGNDDYESLEKIETSNIKILAGIGDRCYIKNTIIDKNVRIGDDVKIDGGPHLKDQETEYFVVKDGIVVIKKGAVIPKGFSL
jgi:glucose-1-phosphate adenylyltransferase